MDDNGVEDLSNLGGSGGTIQLALDALKQKKSSVDQVTSWIARQKSMEVLRNDASAIPEYSRQGLERVLACPSIPD